MRVETFVFFDIESTGLPIKEYNQTKITELAFLAVSRSDLEAASGKDLPSSTRLSFLFNPERKVTPEAEDLTGLTQEYLADKPLFKDKIEALHEFLDLPKPVCLVAHNGNKFDFKILRAEYNDAAAKLPTGLVCLDTFLCFKKILPKSCYRSLALKNVYKTMLNKEPKDSHRAEPDCALLLECVIDVKQSFLEYADKYNKPISKIVPLRKLQSN